MKGFTIERLYDRVVVKTNIGDPASITFWKKPFLDEALKRHGPEEGPRKYKLWKIKYDEQEKRRTEAIHLFKERMKADILSDAEEG